MPDPKEYSLWLISTGATQKQLQRLIKRLSREYCTVPFEPHVTLLGGIREPRELVIRKTAKLTRLIGQFEIKLARLNYRNKFFQCLFVKANKTPELVRARRIAEKFFRQKKSAYMPHLSLIYGLLPVKTKEKIISKIGRNFKTKFVVKGISVVYRLPSQVRFQSVKKFSLRP